MLADAGFPICLNPDDRSITTTTARRELHRVTEALGVTAVEHAAMAERAAVGAFLPDDRRADLVARVRAGWDVTVPRLVHLAERSTPDTVVELAAGLSRRGAHMSERIRYVEVDLPVTSADDAVKRRRYTAEAIAERRRLVELAIDARHEHHPGEAPYPMAEASDRVRRWTTDERAEHLRDYARGTIFI